MSAEPTKFVIDQTWAMCIQGVIGSVSFTLGFLSAFAGDGGSFPIPVFQFGIILAVLLLVLIVDKAVILAKVRSKEGTVAKWRILEVLEKHKSGKILKLATLFTFGYCVPATIMIGIGGVNCTYEDNHEYDAYNPLLNNTKKIKNNCYYDVTADLGNTYRGFAIGMLVCHILSFLFLFFVLDEHKNVTAQIKDDQRPPSVITSPFNLTEDAGGASAAPAPVAPPKPHETERAKKLLARERELKQKITALEERERVLRVRLADAQRSLATATPVSTVPMPPPPSYEELMAAGPSNMQMTSIPHPVESVNLPPIEGVSKNTPNRAAQAGR